MRPGPVWVEQLLTCRGSTFWSHNLGEDIPCRGLSSQPCISAVMTAPVAAAVTAVLDTA